MNDCEKLKKLYQIAVNNGYMPNRRIATVMRFANMTNVTFKMEDGLIWVQAKETDFTSRVSIYDLILAHEGDAKNSFGYAICVAMEKVSPKLFNLTESDAVFRNTSAFNYSFTRKTGNASKKEGLEWLFEFTKPLIEND